MAMGIKSTDSRHLQTIELNVETSSSYDDPSWVPIVSVNSTYTYSPTYLQMWHSYDETPIAPTFLLEAHYDLMDFGKPWDYGTPPVLRRQEYWGYAGAGGKDNSTATAILATSCLDGSPILIRWEWPSSKFGANFFLPYRGRIWFPTKTIQ